MKKTKIVATMSDFRCTEEFVKNLFDAGMDVVRVNSAHVSEEGATHIVETVHRVNPAIPIMIDTKGPEIRVTTIADEYGNSINFRPGDRVAVRGSDGSDKTTRKVVYMNVPNIVDDIPVGARMLIADGELEIRVVGKTAEELTCEFVVGGAMRSRKSVNVPSVSINLPSVTEKDRRFIEWAVKNDVDFIAHSFVRSAKDIKAVQDILDAHGSKIKIISKIENREGLDNIDEIIEASYGIMVARGDLGVEVDMEEVPVLQKQFIHKCNVAAKPVITATQMLDSMIRNPRPTRAEASDVANAIIDGTDAIMLSGETAAGKYPIEAVGTMVRIATYIEAHQLHDNTQLLQQEAVRNATVRTVANAVSYSCCQMARDLNANAIITPSNSGTTARMVARFRPDCPIIAPTPSEHAYHQLGLSYGVMPAHMGVSGDTDELINTAVEAAQQTGLIKTGDVVIISAGVPTGVSGTTNLIKAHIVGNVLLRGIGVGSGCASGNVCTVNTLSDLESDFKDGDVIVTKMTSSEMLPYMRRASAVVVESTNPECHAAVACQAMGIPMMMDRTYQAVHMLKSGMMITVDADEGFIYNGIKA